MRWSQIVQLAVITAIVAAATTAVAVLIPWLPVTASEQRDRHRLHLLAGDRDLHLHLRRRRLSVILFSVVKFRARPDDDTDGPPIHGHTGLEIAWTAVPALLVTVIAIAAAVVLTQNGNAGIEPAAGERHRSAVRLAVRRTRTAARRADGADRCAFRSTAPSKLELHSKDVIHSFWVPAVRPEDGRAAVYRGVPASERARDHADEARHVPDHLHGALRPRPLAHALDGDRDAAG